MTSKPKSPILSAVAAVAAAALMVYGWMQLGPLVMMLFFTTMAVCLMDAFFGRVKLVMFIPCLFLPFISVPGTVVYVALLLMSLIAWTTAGLIILRCPVLAKYLTYGFGDVLGLPLIFALSEIMIPKWGIVILAAVLLAESPLLINRARKAQNIRLLAWFALPIMSVFLAAVLL
jgi:hypothetical protein